MYFNCNVQKNGLQINPNATLNYRNSASFSSSAKGSPNQRKLRKLESSYFMSDCKMYMCKLNRNKISNIHNNDGPE